MRRGSTIQGEPLRPNPPPAGQGTKRRLARRGMTLVEILVVLVVIAMMMAGIIFGSGQVPSARLRASSSLITSAIKAGYTRSNAVSKSVRLVFDFESNTMWLEEANRPMVVQSKDLTGTGGADPATAAEQAAVAEGERIIKGPAAPRPQFLPVDKADLAAREPGGKRPLPRGITFREIQIAHDDQPRTEGRAYLYFWSGGQTERASIQVRIGKDEDDSQTLTLLVAPLTGKVTVKSGPVALKIPDDKEASEREETSP
ncbi:prepilin-type N-terminal cleavage/methylation domain-containing protein [Pendulispora albinea]|uniref:Prepilin-type N-terminal cleavage/methylation domain-containing protein n=1 Tax=Pendulispora albinea TaxID=2741071 RepID=A0ABZ2LKM1_9BACT